VICAIITGGLIPLNKLDVFGCVQWRTPEREKSVIEDD
jgi:hypothetical protein